MVRLSIRHFREKNGRYYWEPSASLKKRGYCSESLGKNRAEAISRAEYLNTEADADRKKEKMPDPEYGTIAWLIKSYCKSSRFKKLRDNTQRDYINKLNIIKKFSGDKPPSALKPRLIEKWYDKIREKNPTYANSIMRVLSVLMDFVVLQEFIDTNPVSKIKMVGVPPRQTIWKNDMIEKIIQTAIEEGETSIAVAIRIAADTGQRQGDILSLKWNDFDGQSFDFKQSKTDEPVRVKATPELRKLLSKITKTSTHIVVSERTHKPYKKHHFPHVFAEIRKKAGIAEKYQFRDLRRTAVLRLALAGATVAEIVPITGHSLPGASRILETYLPKNTELGEHGIQKLVDFEAAKNAKVGKDEK